MKLTAIFESWTVADGSYPHLSVGDIVNLAFELRLRHVSVDRERTALEHVQRAEYAFSGMVLACYSDPEPMVAIDAGTLRFYCEGDQLERLATGMYVSGEGTLFVDYYGWAESLLERPDAPDLFASFCIPRIERIGLTDTSEQEVSSGALRQSADSVRETPRLSDVLSTDSGVSRPQSFLLHLESSNDIVPRTFIG